MADSEGSPVVHSVVTARSNTLLTLMGRLAFASLDGSDVAITPKEATELVELYIAATRVVGAAEKGSEFSDVERHLKKALEAFKRP